MRRRIFVLLTCIIANLTVSAQDSASPKPFAIGVKDQLKSKELSETRILNIYLPEGYNDSLSKYPVIYLLDGSANEDFIHVTGIIQFLTMIGAMPASIIVGIENIDRKRDFTFPTTIEADRKDYPTTGSSEKFILFIEKELQPFIQKKYRVNDRRTIIGQSLGGLVATEILLKKPSLYTDYIIVSPSLWWDNESLLAKAPILLKENKNKNINVVVSVGTEGKIMEDDAIKLSEVLKAAGNNTLNTIFLPLPDENHLTILHNAVYKALLVLNPQKK
jgi:predicted alpha/beta superfamily hydrolase